MNKYALVLFLGIVMITSTVSISFSEAFLPENLPDVSQASQAPSHVRVIEGENIIAYARPLYTSLDDPSNHEVLTTVPHDGVAKLILVRTDGTFGCSGTLASTELHVITAAHCVTDNNGNYVLLSGSSATFEGNFEGNFESIEIDIVANPAESKAHPDYDGDFIKGNDIAVLKLTEKAPLQIPGIPHATSGSEVGDIVDKNGYGLSGFFSSGDDRSNYPFGIERDGQNKYDAFADTMYVALRLTPDVGFIPEAIYQYDSDDGNSPHDAFGFFFGIDDLGLTSGNDPQEVISAPGDSGGPTILGGQLVGVTSYGITLEFRAGPPPRTSDCTTEGVSPIIDSSCGEFAGDTRVSHYTDFIDSVLSTTPQDPTISIDDVTQAEGDSGTTNFVFTVTRSGDTTGSSSVSFATADGTATTVDGDYISASGTVSFGTGVTQQTVTVTVNGDTDVEPDENFAVNLSSCSGCTISDSQGVGTITNDDFLPSISIDDVTQAEGDSGTTNFVFTVTRSGDTTGSSSVSFATADGTATTVDGDYISASGTVSFGTGVTQQTVTVTVNGDTTPEPDENFAVNLSSCSGCTISDSQGVGTITNDDTPVGVSVDSILPPEIAKGTTLRVEITGSGFQSEASVTFENGCGPSPSASIVSVSVDGTSITADITTKSGGPNKNCTFDVRVTNPDAITDVLPQSFTVLP